MPGSERDGAERLPGPGGFFSRKELAVISALMDYLGLESVGYGTAVALLALIRALHDRCRAL